MTKQRIAEIKALYDTLPPMIWRHIIPELVVALEEEKKKVIRLRTERNIVAQKLNAKMFSNSFLEEANS